MRNKGRAIPEHKKHSAFPGLILAKDVRIESGSIRSSYKKPVDSSVPPKSKAFGAEWDRYETAIMRLRDSNANASSSALQIRNGFEFAYYLACKELIKKGLISKPKRKYRLH
jgi:hypothetical protein